MKPPTITTPVVQLRDATLRFGGRTLWSGLDLDVARGEFVAVLGSNGSGKTSLLKVLLGLQPLTAGSAHVLGQPLRRGNHRIGYIPQQKLADDGTPLRARDLVGLGIDGHRFGFPWPSAGKRDRVDRLLADVGATALGDVPISQLSGGEQQRVRVAQAIAAEPEVLLCDEPLISLDLRHQRSITELIDAQRTRRNLGVLFVTHDVNPILGMVDRILYLAGGQFRIGTPTEVLDSEVLSELYQSPVEVIHTGDRVVVVGTPDGAHTHPDNPYEVHHAHGDTDDDDPAVMGR
ncbi:metal ABC transporter ATP-binding protein [Homoserinimonas sp. OAct 916]|uniref:metal ABC transporter ATP-binding protein n=1 Tax=Homoserinimonas sp. OAct 916 TaxID=2211450 RepID=UPI000DBE4F1B|nr:ABC transporter ATP-binding protein [Homoserinimonas sp. OAct 916]